MLILILTYACGNSPQSNVNINSPVQQSDELQSLSIKKINGKPGWKNSISTQLFEELSQNRYAEIFTIDFSEEDLNLLGCTNYNLLNIEEKKLFIIVFLAAIAERESDFDPLNMTYDPTHKNWNIGLLQIDEKSALRHSGEFYSEKELKDSYLNLKVGLSIFKNQITGKYRPELNGKLFTGKSFYWEVLNDNYKHRVVKSFLNNRFNLSFCQD